MTEPLPPAASGVEFELASIWARVGGRIMDFVLIYFIVPLVLVAVMDLETDPDLLVESGDLQRVALITLAIFVVYETLFVATWGRTIGKAVIGTRVVGTGGEDPPRWTAALVRAIVPVAPSLVIPDLGTVIMIVIYGWLAWDRNRQGLHDKAAKTYVVKNRPPS
jgi:uncharacterized RDD family membrane protein YckC